MNIETGLQGKHIAIGVTDTLAMYLQDHPLG
jgi:hypothetical protein